MQRGDVEAVVQAINSEAGDGVLGAEVQVLRGTLTALLQSRSRLSLAAAGGG